MALAAGQTAEAVDVLRVTNRPIAVSGGTKTISTGVVTLTPNNSNGEGFYVIAAETGTADDLDTINGLSDGDIAHLIADSGDTITLKHNTGNIQLEGGDDLDVSDDLIVSLRYDGSNLYLIGIPALTIVLPLVPGGRLTMTSNTPVTTADVTAATTIYYTPYVGNTININGTWLTFSETSVSVPATTTTPFDIFAYDNNGTLALETLNWTNDTTRATAIAIANDGRYYKSGDATRLYLGTGRTTGTSGRTEDSESSRFLWNMYNRVLRFLECHDTTNTWAYTTATWRATNASTTVGVGRVECVIGVSETLVRALITGSFYNASGATAANGVGIDSTSANSAQVYGAHTATGQCEVTTKYAGYPSAGYHYIQSLEISTATGTTTWNGDYGTTNMQHGMVVEMEM